MGETLLDFDADEAGRSSTAGLKPSRAIGGSLNALVRATMLYRKRVEKWALTSQDGASETQRMVAERAAAAWRKARPNALDVDALQVTVGGELALKADSEAAQWILYAFMAGVRRITPRPAMTASDVIRLVQELVALEPTVASIEHFRNWLDADGAEGFEVRVHTSFREVMEEVDLEEEREFSSAFALARFEVPRAGDAVFIAAKDLDMVAMRKEFEMPIEMYTHEAAAADGGLSDADLQAIGARCDDANAWTTAEIEAVLALPELRTAITPEQMARRVVTRLSTEADDRFLMLLTKLNSKTDPFRRAVAKALGTQEVGEIIARQLQLNSDARVEALGKFLALSAESVAQAVTHGLIDRAVDDTQALEALSLLCEWYGGPQVCAWVVPANLTVETAALLGRVLGRCAGAPAEVTRIVSAASLEAGLALLSALPEAALPALGRAARFLWGRAKGEAVEQVAELMVKTRAPDNLKVLGALLLDGKLDAWRGRTLYALCGGLVEQGLGKAYVLPLALRRGRNEQVRLICIDCTRRNDELAAEICRFRFSRLLESAPIRDRIRKLAKERGAQGKGA